MRSVSHSVTEELEERSEYGRVASSLASIGSSTTDGCVIKAKASFATKDVYDQCDKTMARADAIIPPISGNCVPLCYADGKMPSHLRDAGSAFSSLSSPPEIDPEFESIDRLRTAVTNLSTETFFRLVGDHLSFKDDNFQTVMVKCNGGGGWGA